MKAQINHLLCIVDTDGVRTIVLNQDNYSIGRDPQNAVVLFSKTVSRYHAILTRVPGDGSTDYHYRIVDGDASGKLSTNGITVNDQRCDTHYLSSGDVIAIGGVQASYYIQRITPSGSFLDAFVDLQQVEELAQPLNPHATIVGQSVPPDSVQDSRLEFLEEDDLPPTTLFRQK